MDIPQKQPRLPLEIKLVLADTNPDALEAWRHQFAPKFTESPPAESPDGESPALEMPSVEIHDCDFLDVDADALIVPGNSFGFLDGGVELRVSERLGMEPQDRLRGRIRAANVRLHHVAGLVYEVGGRFLSLVFFFFLVSYRGPDRGPRRPPGEISGYGHGFQMGAAVGVRGWINASKSCDRLHLSHPEAASASPGGRGAGGPVRTAPARLFGKFWSSWAQNPIFAGQSHLSRR